ncbi:amidohydrolase/deacetylase family metallohydrolase [Candidatus Bathyarchaeota archaeon]|nr:MAG: amidohydrolase/deacetylase family metallohydrolase [Candidatus Bathyarchaeota archaeon]
MHDLVVKNGTVIDPSQKIHEQKDIAISEGKITDLRKGINAAGAKHVIDASGLIVTPGLVDLHVHCSYRIVHLAVDPELICLAKGSTTVLDAGSTGELNFTGFRKYVIEPSRLKIFALLNIESLGMIEYGRGNLKWPSLITGRDEMFINIENTLEAIRRNRDVILGIKWAHHGIKGVALAREAADKANCFLMAENHLQPETLRYMKKGDIITHLYHGLRVEQHDGLLDENYKVQPEFFDAVKRGVILDVGHGAGSFVWEIAEKGLEQGIKPDTISTDLHVGSFNGPVYDLPTTMSKFLLLGLSLDEVVEASTTKPAEVLGKQNEIGTLKPGACADLTVFKLEEGKFRFVDVNKKQRMGRQKLTVTNVVKSGEIVF